MGEVSNFFVQNLLIFSLIYFLFSFFQASLIFSIFNFIQIFDLAKTPFNHLDSIYYLFFSFIAFFIVYFIFLVSELFTSTFFISKTKKPALKTIYCEFYNYIYNIGLKALNFAVIGTFQILFLMIIMYLKSQVMNNTGYNEILILIFEFFIILLNVTFGYLKFSSCLEIIIETSKDISKNCDKENKEHNILVLFNHFGVIDFFTIIPLLLFHYLLFSSKIAFFINFRDLMINFLNISNWNNWRLNGTLNQIKPNFINILLCYFFAWNIISGLKIIYLIKSYLSVNKENIEFCSINKKENENLLENNHIIYI